MYQSRTHGGRHAKNSPYPVRDIFASGGVTRRKETTAQTQPVRAQSALAHGRGGGGNRPDHRPFYSGRHRPAQGGGGEKGPGGLPRPGAGGDFWPDSRPEQGG